MLIGSGPLLIAVLAGIFLREGPPRRLFVGAMLYLVTLIAIVLGWAILGETPPWLAVAGGAFCLGGVYLARHD